MPPFQYHRCPPSPPVSQVDQLLPSRLEDVCKAKGIDLILRMQEGYDHSYYFISTFVADHLAFHAQALKQ